MKKVLLLALVASVHSASAEGLYGKLYAGNSQVDDAFIDDSTSSFGVAVGYRFTENYGAELGFQDFGSLSTNIPGRETSSNGDAFTIALSGRYALHADDFQGFYVDGRFGLANYGVETRQTFSGTGAAVRTTKSGSDPFFSLGFGYDMTENLSMGLNYSRFAAKSDVRPSAGGANKETDIEFPQIALSAEWRF